MANWVVFQLIRTKIGNICELRNLEIVFPCRVQSTLKPDLEPSPYVNSRSSFKVLCTLIFQKNVNQPTMEKVQIIVHNEVAFTGRLFKRRLLVTVHIMNSQLCTSGSSIKHLLQDE
jgi:hypothetical protein